MASSILVVGEVGEGGLAPITKEMLGAGRRLSADGSVGCALIGSGVEAHAQSAIAHGAAEVFVVDHSIKLGFRRCKKSLTCYGSIIVKVCQ